nr:somatomedin-B and thrombospondin type-1 domain-containing protein-like [Pogona vitticeps]
MPQQPLGKLGPVTLSRTYLQGCCVDNIMGRMVMTFQIMGRKVKYNITDHQEISCVVSDWSEWSGCAEPCKATYRIRRRQIIQEPRNGGEPCPPLEEKAGCLEYWTHQGTKCKQSLIPALITTGGYGKARKKRAVFSENERVGYCVEFQLMAIAEGCLHGNSSYTHWMKYLSEGHRVCVECQHPALDSRSLHCSGDGSEAKKNQLLHWQAVGNPRCRGTWKRVRQLDICSCPSVHTFLFI